MEREWSKKISRKLYKRLVPRLSYLRKSHQWLRKDFNKILSNITDDRAERDIAWRKYREDIRMINDDIQIIKTVKIIKEAEHFDVPKPQLPLPDLEENENWRRIYDYDLALTRKGLIELRREVRIEKEAGRRWWGGWIPTFINVLIVIAMFGTLWETHQDRTAADTALLKAQAVEEKVTDMVLNQIVLSEFMQEGIAYGGKFILDSEVQSSIDSILALTIPEPMERQEWSERLRGRVADARKKREEIRKKEKDSKQKSQSTKGPNP